jgi:hypothetical protein
MSRGRKKTPTAILRLRGSRRADDRPDEPEALRGVPIPPAWLSDRARDRWPEVCRALIGLGVLSAPYTVGVALLADAIGDFAYWAERESENPRDCVAIGLKAKASERAMKYLEKFGGVPSAFASMKLPQEEKPVDGIDAFKLSAG